jgi:molybdate transport system substrate-binding protein
LPVWRTLFRRFGRRLAVATAAVMAVASIACGGGGENDSILVLAAASMTNALVDVGTEFERDSGVKVIYSFGGSNALVRQIELGAPSDAVIFAGRAPMDRLETSGNVLAGSRMNLLQNRLVVIGNTDSKQLADLGEMATLEGRIAVADPAFAPAGLYAKQALETVGLWNSLESRIIPTLDVRAAVGAVDTGSVVFGLAYATDVVAVSGVDVVLEIPETFHDPIVYPVAVVDGAGNSDQAQAFLSYLSSERGHALFMRHGFVPAAE